MDGVDNWAKHFVLGFFGGAISERFYSDAGAIFVITNEWESD